jgi:hypothetical protein
MLATLLRPYYNVIIVLLLLLLLLLLIFFFSCIKVFMVAISDGDIYNSGLGKKKKKKEKRKKGIFFWLVTGKYDRDVVRMD